MGTEEEIKDMVKSLQEQHRVLQVSDSYKNRGVTEYVRVYVELEVNNNDHTL